MRIIEALIGEHGALGAMLDHLEQAVPLVGGHWELRAQIGVLRSVMGSQMTIEEEMLFSALEHAIGRDGPLAALRMEHDKIEGALSWVPQIENLDEAKQLLVETVRLARQNFQNEEHVLFRLAEEHLHPDLLEELGRQWAERRGVAVFAQA
ncbi:MAG: hemerythrin domain-containing protein [Candidatus Sericytochromatia bacterium]|nr:hemerythrin domain-containing protein [Candidatus Tanganyikabacteria bacterium]